MVRSLVTRITRFLRSEDGPTAAEYAGLLALILIVLVLSITAVGHSTSSLWSSDVAEISAAVNAS